MSIHFVATAVLTSDGLEHLEEVPLAPGSSSGSAAARNASAQPLWAQLSAARAAKEEEQALQEKANRECSSLLPPPLPLPLLLLLL
jgi:hypothetical protein